MDNDVPCQQKGKIRVSRPWTHKSNVYKHKVQHGLERTTKSGNIIPAKKFEIQMDCVCKKKCAERIDGLQQQKLFDNFYEMSASQKTLYLRGCVQRGACKQRICDKMPIIPLKLKKYTNTYLFLDENNISQHVCRKFFLTCLQLGPSSVRNALMSETNNPTAVEKRGRHPPKLKTPTEDRNFAREFIEAIPACKTRGRKSQNSKKYLSSKLNRTKIYNEYVEYCAKQQRTPVSKYVFSDVFNKDCNLAFEKPQSKDTK
ncbi:uncharacterized protein LOC129807986 isoform X2 [Phlebotomus papatasi]|uniref:uncharacterized protein LOC129807986 isoform X2 n=1 Tax=Phlebotomus papatasi TaxID=29031 RepID=UPI0024835C02|nr:uncharacterized protein LOC129807986 isoform X2 [Phlebotomus papatasi]